MNTGVMLAFLPTNTDWCKQDLPHVTLVYCGTTDQLKPSDQNALSKDALTVAQTTDPFSTVVTGVEVFGQGTMNQPKVDVLTLYLSPKLLLARQLVEKWNASQYKNYEPHATVGPEGSATGTLPTVLYFDRLLMAWGDKQLIFPLYR